MISVDVIKAEFEDLLSEVLLLQTIIVSHKFLDSDDIEKIIDLTININGSSEWLLSAVRTLYKKSVDENGRK
jgi:hypothetical protein